MEFPFVQQCQKTANVFLCLLSKTEQIFSYQSAESAAVCDGLLKKNTVV